MVASSIGIESVRAFLAPLSSAPEGGRALTVPDADGGRLLIVLNARCVNLVTVASGVCGPIVLDATGVFGKRGPKVMDADSGRVPIARGDGFGGPGRGVANGATVWGTVPRQPGVGDDAY